MPIRVVSFRTISRGIIPGNKIFLMHVRFIKDSDILKGIKGDGTDQHSRESTYDGNVKYILPLLKEGKYKDVQVLVQKYNIDINSHEYEENTPLTYAAEIGDVKAVKFLLNTMKANIHTSCRCPFHKTALHYAAENGHYEVVKVLLEFNAKPNILDARKYTPLDVAKNKQIRLLLESKGGMKGKYVKIRSGQELNLPRVNCPSLSAK